LPHCFEFPKRRSHVSVIQHSWPATDAATKVVSLHAVSFLRFAGIGSDLRRQFI
jgi:hypothetical protein